MARNISPNSADAQRSKHSPWHLKKQSLLRPPSLDKRGQYHRYFYYFLEFTSQAHLPIVRHLPTQQVKLSAVCSGKTTTPKMLYT